MFDMTAYANRLLHSMAAAQTAPHWYCPYCGKDYGPHPDPLPTAVACCGELGHLTQEAPQ